MRKSPELLSDRDKKGVEIATFTQHNGNVFRIYSKKIILHLLLHIL